MRRDYLFLLGNVPKDRLLHGQNFFMATLAGQAIEQLHQLSKQIPALARFLIECGSTAPTYLVVRNEVDDEEKALNLAAHTRDFIIDGYSLFIETTVPHASSVVQIRRGESPDVELISNTQHAWVLIDQGNKGSARQWQERNDALLQTAVHFFDAATNHSDGDDLSEQLLYAAKMWRHGRTCHVFGIDYLCRFTALEGLVCGSANRDKKAMLQDRLSKLLPSRSSLKSETQKLWDLRCDASHKGKAFEIHGVTKSPILAPWIVLLEYYFIAALVFALENPASATTVAALWNGVTRYKPPRWATMERPTDMPKWPVTKGAGTLAVIPGTGGWIDEFFGKLSLLRDQAKSSVAQNQTDEGQDTVAT